MNLRQKFKTELDTCTWNLLDKNIDRGAVLIIHDLDILDVAVAIAEDQVQTISNWLSNKQIESVPPEESKKDREGTFQYLIIQPYVIIKKVSEN